MSFVHLHSHSEYSMLDGASRVKEMFKRAADLGMPALALTDHGVMYGAIPFYLEGKATGVKPLIGMEAYVAPRTRFDKPAVREDWYYHLTMIAATDAGYRNLVKLSSLGFLEGYDGRSRRPRLDKELLSKFSDGIVVLSGCLSGELAKNIVGGRLTEAERVAAEYKELFGDHYFLEIQNQGLVEQSDLNRELAVIAERLHIPLVATNDSHYTHKEDAEAHDILLCIQTGKQLSDTKRLKFDTDQFYLKGPDEMKAAFVDYPASIENTLAVAEMCNVEIPLNNMLLPAFDTPQGEGHSSYLRRLTEEGIAARFNPVTPEVEQRYRRELQSIEQMAFVDYFLIVADFVGWAKRNGIRVGPGRGSVGGSIVAYALRITDLDPIRWNLGFERFLNPGRKELPDIDIDFDERRRSEVIRYVSDRYGEDRVAQIITFSTIKAKAAIRDAARVLGMPYSVGDRLAKMFPPLVLGKEAPFDACFDKKFEWPENSARNDAFPNAGELRRTYEEDETSRQVIDTARKLEGLRRQHSVHAAGVVIGAGPLTDHVPVQRTDGGIVTQFEMSAIVAIGLLKMDFLGLRNLTVIGDSLEHIKVNHGIEVDIDNLPLDDPLAYKLLQEGASAGIFQMESPGMVRLCRQLRPDRFEEIAALIALFRPGPMDEIPRYIKGKHDPSSVTYFHPLLSEVLKDTNGVIVYQEQVTEMLQVVAGFSATDADMVRYAIGKKKSHELVKWKDQFQQGSEAAGLTTNEANGLWELIRPFAGYSFNRAHANGYGLIAYQTAWLKAHYPVEYMAALLTSVKDRADRMPYYLAECKALGIKVLPPNVNESSMDFTPRGAGGVAAPIGTDPRAPEAANPPNKMGEILFGLSAIRNVGEGVAERIIRSRSSGGPFAGFYDFVRRVDASCLNKKVIESLAKAGAFDALGIARTSLLAPDNKDVAGVTLSEQAMSGIETVIAERRREDAGQFTLFAGQATAAAPAANFEQTLVAADDIPKTELLKAEKEMLGVYVSEHPLEAVWSALRYQTDCEISDLAEETDGSIKAVGGILARMTRKFTKKGDVWFNGYLEDMKGEVEVNFWPQTVAETSPALLMDDAIVILKGRVEVRDEKVKLMATKITGPDLSGAVTPLRIKMPATSCTPQRIEELKGVLSAHPGPSPVLLHLASSGRRTTVLKLADDFNVELRNGLFAEIKSVLGPGAIA